MDDKYALLIDADNVSAKYIKPILDELSKYGNVTYKRIYGDWTSTYSSSWKEELLQNSITPIQQFSYTHGKNATDSAMIIDAMDMLYTSELEGFCLVSSDSDFTKLASRLRESGKTVIGMGEDKTPVPFRKACDIFTVLELLLEDNTIEKEEKALVHATNKESKKCNTDVVSKNQIEEAVVKIITENQNNDKETGLGEVGSRLVKLYPDFDVRRYGYSLLSKFLETFPKLKLKQDGTQVTVTVYEDKSKKEMLEEYIIMLVQNAGAQGVSLGTLGNKIRNRFGDFKVRDYGYSQFKQYIQSFPEIQIRDDGEQNWAVYGKNYKGV
ncbi:NYN domain-containing protein [Faecalicatena sp. AGMB00832]|uniref:NYN domain-containing protein n=1 Tax=Faecalicatena faecalis TaxID=2726362 RepID=A0ABS6D4W8_9FIRM|nr:MULTISPECIES: NYN domain-containing protein [Faecalicatena]MBU3876637.1 NYN domain-containing protein [Faecalicatena faecalis]MCI6464692.1 NYN domain-containing protein [Faecalicatena sp.]MDY5618270.1 NYN domain-containing protein [Lachnospiraceae bacterium]